MTAKFEVGQTVYLEYLGGLWIPSPSDERKIIECEVVKFNKTSVYIISKQSKAKYPDWETRNYLLDRITIKTLTGKSTFDKLKLWLTKDDFNQSVKAQAENSRIKKEAREKFNRQRISKLKQFLEDVNYD